MTIFATRANREITIRFEDDGPGFPPGLDLEQLFEIGFSTHPGSQGLGLRVVRNIVAAHGGWIHAERNQPNGAVFVVSLPVAEGGTAV